MAFLLNSQNVFDYLIANNICQPYEAKSGTIELKAGKNFNLLVSLPESGSYLVKQERFDNEGKSYGEFAYEWRIQEFLTNFSELEQLRNLVSEIRHCDRDSAILVVKYLTDYWDLSSFYYTKQTFPPEIGTSLGTALATLHRHTLDRQEYRQFLVNNLSIRAIDRTPNFLQRLQEIKPEIFGHFSRDGLEFIKLYQRYESLEQAIIAVKKDWDSCCLIHSDLRPENILLHKQWEKFLLSSEHLSLQSFGNTETNNLAIRLIDWERYLWGDPAFDLGKLIASYLGIWLFSLDINQAIDIKTALLLAQCPLEKLQHTLINLTQAYLQNFPEIMQRNPDFLNRVMQFSGIVLIQGILNLIDHHKPFGNRGICILQVAKTLLCSPEDSIKVIFGVDKSHLTRYCAVAI